MLSSWFPTLYFSVLHVVMSLISIFQFTNSPFSLSSLLFIQFIGLLKLQLLQFSLSRFPTFYLPLGKCVNNHVNNLMLFKNVISSLIFLKIVIIINPFWDCSIISFSFSVNSPILLIMSWQISLHGFHFILNDFPLYHTHCQMISWFYQYSRLGYTT